MKKSNLKVVKIDKNKSLFNYEKKILIKELTLDLKLGYYDFEKEKPQRVRFSLEIDYEDKKPTSDKDIKSIVNYGQVVKLIKKLTKNKHYNFLETLADNNNVFTSHAHVSQTQYQAWQREQSRSQKMRYLPGFVEFTCFKIFNIGKLRDDIKYKNGHK